MKKDIYMVGLLPGKIKSKIFLYQKSLSELYGLYDSEYPELHITLAKLYYNNRQQIGKFIDSLSAIFQDQKPLSVEIDGISCFGSPFKSVNLHVKSREELVSLSLRIINTARESGLECPDSHDNWQYHISVANSTFAQKEWSEAEYEEACSLLRKENISDAFFIDCLQLWYPLKQDYVAATFPLKY